MTSRFADTAATRRVELGPCGCEGTPHESDYALVRAELSTPEIADIEAAGRDTIAQVISRFVTEWNLLGPDGKAWPPSPESLYALKPPTLAPIVSAISESMGESSTLPNASGARSASSSRASASRTRATRAKP